MFASAIVLILGTTPDKEDKTPAATTSLRKGETIMANQTQKAIYKIPAVATLFAMLAAAGLLSLMLSPVRGTSPSTAKVEPAFVEPAFVDPTATISTNVRMGSRVYIAPFADIKAGADSSRSITIGDQSNVQDSCVVTAQRGRVQLGELVIIAHGATVKGPASIGNTGNCPPPIAGPCSAFVGFNAEVDGAIIEKDAMVQALARVGPGVTIPSGYKVIPGKNVAYNSEVKAKTEKLTPEDRDFMADVIKVNVEFAQQYAALAGQDPSNVRGINLNPPTSFNPHSELPTLAGQPVKEPQFRNRLIGSLKMADGLDQLQRIMKTHTSLRADEGEPFEVGVIADMKDDVTFHALEHTHIRLGKNGRYGRHSLVHGGPTQWDNYTITGHNFALGDLSVFFRSRIGDNSRIGYKCLVQECDLPAGTRIPNRTVRIQNKTWRVEW
jgi:carbonic anhydrase/acetyltransferase-like protein (isoleucine patch superfamily)